LISETKISLGPRFPLVNAPLRSGAFFPVVFWLAMLRAALCCGMDSLAESLPAVRTKLNLISVNWVRLLGSHSNTLF
jgi:hypothetical protein